MSWIEIEHKEYRAIWEEHGGCTLDGGRLGLFSTASFSENSHYFPGGYWATSWGIRETELPVIKSLKENGKWQYWKWEGPAPKEDEN